MNRLLAIATARPWLAIAAVALAILAGAGAAAASLNLGATTRVAGTTHPAPTATAKQTANSASPSTSPAPTPSPQFPIPDGCGNVTSSARCAVAALTVECRLPVSLGGFIQFPSAQYQGDINSHAIGGTTTYVVATSTWVSATRLLVAPDGHRFVTRSDANQYLDLVDLPDGTRRHLSSAGVYPVGYEPEGVYATAINTGDLVLFPGDSPQATTVAPGFRAIAVGNGYAYRSGGGGVSRMSVHGGQVQHVLTGTNPSFLGFDAAGGAIFQNGPEVDGIGLDGAARRLLADFRVIGQVTADSNGVWMASASGLFLVSPDGLLHRMQSATSGQGYQVPVPAGICR